MTARIKRKPQEARQLRPFEAIPDEVKRDAFEYYYALGPGRNYRQVASKFGRGYMTIAKWGTKFKWGDRVSARDKGLAIKQEEASVRDILATRIKYKFRLDEMITDFFNELHRRAENGQPVTFIQSLDDLERVVKLSLAMLGDTIEAEGPLAERTTVITEKIRTDPRAREYLTELYRIMHSDGPPKALQQEGETVDAEIIK